MHSARRALIAGLGLIGGSIGMALRRRGWHITYLDPAVSLDEASRAQAANDRTFAVESGFDVTILATPIDVAVASIRDCRSRTTSVCSVMEPLRSAADAHGVDFVAGHPFAGSHEHSLAAARADLFEGAPWFVDREDPVVSEMIDACGAKASPISPGDHDRAVALTSHLPQILSTALAACLHDQSIDPQFIGSGLRTFLRLSGSAASVWSPIIAANRANIAPHLAELERVVRELLEENDPDPFRKANEWFASADGNPAGSRSPRGERK